MSTPSVRSLAYYLPQFHPVPENDLWWGKGFTDWTNVAAAKPLFEGHAQPRLPRDLGFYDLRSPESREAQAELARQHGIDGFIYYHYWFDGRQVLERPFEEVLNSNGPDFPFALCWANEDWRRNWDGRSGEVLLAQTYSEADDREHMRWIIRAMRDERYIRIDDKPLLIVHRVAQLPEASRTADIWREEARIAGIGEIFLAYSENMERVGDPRSIGFDAAIEFAPDWQISEGQFHGTLETHDYLDTAAAMLSKPDPDYRRFPCVTPAFDNTPRKGTEGYVLTNSHPDLYKGWVAATVQNEIERGHSDVVLFVNAWNEWAEGAMLEPCSVWGTSYLEAHAAGVAQGVRPAQATPAQPETATAVPVDYVVATSTGYTTPAHYTTQSEPVLSSTSTTPPSIPTSVPTSVPTSGIDIPIATEAVTGATIPTGPGLTVAVVTNGDAEALMTALRSALDNCQGMGMVDFLVVDNATQDDTAALLEALGNDVRSVRAETALTPPAAWMLAKQASRGEYVLLMSTDVTLTSGWLEPVIMSLAFDPFCMAASPAQAFNGQAFPSQPLTSVSGVCLLVRESTDVSTLNEAKYVPESVVNYSVPLEQALIPQAE